MIQDDSSFDIEKYYEGLNVSPKKEYEVKEFESVRGVLVFFKVYENSVKCDFPDRYGMFSWMLTRESYDRLGKSNVARLLLDGIPQKNFDIGMFRPDGLQGVNVESIDSLTHQPPRPWPKPRLPEPPAKSDPVPNSSLIASWDDERLLKIPEDLPLLARGGLISEDDCERLTAAANGVTKITIDKPYVPFASKVFWMTVGFTAAWLQAKYNWTDSAWSYAQFIWSQHANLESFKVLGGIVGGIGVVYGVCTAGKGFDPFDV